MAILTADQFSGVHVQRRGDCMFPHLYRSPAFVFVATAAASAACFTAVATLLATSRLDWLVPLPTFTSRQLFVGRLSDKGSTLLPDLIFKRSNFRPTKSSCPAQRVLPCAHEIRMTLALDALVWDLQQANRLPVPEGFHSLTVRVETPMGILVDKVHQSAYSVFAFERGLDTGERLLFYDPPLHGASNYSQPHWQIYCAIRGLLDIVKAEALKRSLLLEDLGVHQVLYRAPEQARTLDVVLIDAERIQPV